MADHNRASYKSIAPRTLAVLGPLNLQPLLANRTIGGKLRRRPLEHDAAVAHDVEAAGNLQRDGELLFDQQNRRAAAGDLVEQLADLFDQFWRKPFGRLV